MPNVSTLGICKWIRDQLRGGRAQQGKRPLGFPCADGAGSREVAAGAAAVPVLTHRCSLPPGCGELFSTPNPAPSRPRGQVQHVGLACSRTQRAEYKKRFVVNGGGGTRVSDTIPELPLRLWTTAMELCCVSWGSRGCKDGSNEIHSKIPQREQKSEVGRKPATSWGCLQPVMGQGLTIHSPHFLCV